MNNFIINGDAVLLCTDDRIRSCVLQSLGIEKNIKQISLNANTTNANLMQRHKQQSIAPTKTSDVMNKVVVSTSTSTTSTRNFKVLTVETSSDIVCDQFEYFKNVVFYVTTQFENVMINDTFFYKNSFHATLVDMKNDIANATTTSEKINHSGNVDTKQTRKKIKANSVNDFICETVLCSHEIFDISEPVSNKLNGVVGPSQKLQGIKNETIRRKRSASLSEGKQTLKQKKISEQIPKTLYKPDICYRKISDVCKDQECVQIQIKNSNILLTNTNEDKNKTTMDKNKENIRNSNIRTAFSEVDRGALDAFDLVGLNHISKGIKNKENMKLTNLHDTYDKEDWYIIYWMIKTYGFSFSDAKEFTMPFKLPSPIVLSKTKPNTANFNYVGLCTSVLSSDEIACVDINIYVPMEYKLFTFNLMEVVLSETSSNEQKSTHNNESSKSDSTASEDNSSDLENENNHSDVTGTDQECNSSAAEFDEIRPKRPLCYIIFLNLEETPGNVANDLKSIAIKLKQIIAMDAIPSINVLDIISLRDNGSNLEKLQNFVTEVKFDNNKTFVVVVGHSSKNIVLQQIEEIINLPIPNNNKNKNTEDKTEYPQETSFEGNSSKDNKNKIKNVEKNIESIYEIGEKFFSNNFVFFNIDCTSPLQIVLTFQKIATIIFRQNLLSKMTSYNSHKNKDGENSNASITSYKKQKYRQKFADSNLEANVRDEIFLDLLRHAYTTTQ